MKKRRKIQIILFIDYFKSKRNNKFFKVLIVASVCRIKLNSKKFYNVLQRFKKNFIF